MNQYMLLLHERPAGYASLTPADMQELIARYTAWSEQMASEGRLAGGSKLTDDGGRHLRMAGDRPLATDGPYAEAHDLIGGFYLVQAPDLAAAEAIAAECPHLSGRQWIEIRTVETLG